MIQIANKLLLVNILNITLERKPVLRAKPHLNGRTRYDRRRNYRRRFRYVPRLAESANTAH